MNDEFTESARIVVKDCMGITEDENVGIITDENLKDIGYAIWQEARKITRNAVFVQIEVLLSHGSEPPKQVGEFMKECDVVIAPTSKSLTHTEARRNACEKGARISTMPAILKETFSRAVNADYNKIAELTHRLEKALWGKNEIRITSPKGTDIKMIINGRDPFADTGIYHNPGDFGNLPAGETFLAPLEGTSNGVVVFDGSFPGLGLLDEPLKFIVKDGYAVDIIGKRANEARNLMEPFGQDAFNVAELGIGTNYKAKICGSVLEDEKVLGTCHIAFGDNRSMGGVVRVASHLDGIIFYPDIEVDGKLILKNGKILI